MKKVFLSLALASTLFLSSCIGSFGLTNKYFDWNNQVSNKYVNELIFLGSNIIPIYPLCLLADGLVLNSIEFWTGSNPIASKTEVINTEDGKYLVESNENGYTITKGDETVQFINENGVWFVNQDNQKVEMFRYVDDSHICLNLGETSAVVELSQEGVDNFRTAYAK
ncbi:MAG: DUF3332 domain-containing protein [Bacteroidales bacterium]|nr:DUF3332 domain-containing protein [Bacteroidales bacterium]